jgi:PAS domain S-box-containing protein
VSDAEKSSKQPILLVDDRIEDIVVLKSILDAPDREIVTASSGAEALRHLLARDFAAVVLDVVMPGMDGFELASLIRERQRTAQLPLLFLTGIGDDARFIYRAYAVGAVDILTKPVDPDILRAKIGVFVELYKKDRRIEQQTEALLAAERREKRAELTRVRMENARRYQSLADAISHIVWMADKTGQLTHVNRRWVEYFGSEIGDPAGSWLDVVHPDEREQCGQRWEEARSNGEPFEAECRLRRADGEHRWHLCRALPEHDDLGVLTGWFGTHTDLDEVVRARMETEDSRQRLTVLAEVSALLSGSLDVAKGLSAFAEHAVSNIADAVVVDVTDLDAGTPLVHLAHAREGISAAPCERLAGTMAGAIHDESSLLVSQIKDELLKNVARDADELASLRALGLRSALVVPVVSRKRTFGTIALLSTGAERTFDADDLAMAVEIGRRAGTAVDNALLYRAAERAVQARDDFLSVASHELRTPLSALLLQLGSLAKHLPEDAPVTSLAASSAKKVAAALRHTNRLAKLVDNLLDVSRLSTKTLALELEECDLGAVARDVVERFTEEAKEAKCQLVLQGGGDAIGSWDRLRVEQVVTNLLSNALKYGRGAPIELSIDGDERTARITIRDHGIGIAQEDHTRVFGRFERAVPLRHYGGLGLGLYIVRQIVEAHRGTVRIDSQRGLGTTFVVSLPRAPRAADARTPTIVTSASQPPAAPAP